jgi:hypothetical protein
MHLVRLYAAPACFRVSTWHALLGPRMAGFRRNSPSNSGWGRHVLLVCLHDPPGSDGIDSQQRGRFLIFAAAAIGGSETEPTMRTSCGSISPLLDWKHILDQPGILPGFSYDCSFSTSQRPSRPIPSASRGTQGNEWCQALQI